MSNPLEIRRLNDSFRRSLSGGVKRLITAGIAALPYPDEGRHSRQDHRLRSVHRGQRPAWRALFRRVRSRRAAHLLEDRLLRSVGRMRLAGRQARRDFVHDESRSVAMISPQDDEVRRRRYRGVLGDSRPRRRSYQCALLIGVSADEIRGLREGACMSEAVFARD
jgi:hypothetical protein